MLQCPLCVNVCVVHRAVVWRRCSGGLGALTEAVADRVELTL